MRRRVSWLLSPLVAACASTKEGEEVSFRDPKDGRFDASQYLATRAGFMPVPLVITEPAVGYGGGLGVMFLHPKEPDANGVKPKGPPSITAFAAGYTESDTWFAGAGHFGSWDDDRWRYAGVLGGGVANLQFDGIGEQGAGTGGERSLDYELDGLFLRQQLLGRIAETPLFLGMRYQIASTKTQFDAGAPQVDFPVSERQDAALSAVAQFDTRDSIFTPDRGVNATLVASHFDPDFGGDAEYDRLDLEAPAWAPLTSSLVLGVRPSITFTDGDAPFYALPYVELRGVPVLRYQGRDAASIEAELRWNFDPRWAIVGFGGVGQAVADTSEFGGESYTVGAGGTGFRYLLASQYGLHVGVDVAKGPEDWAVYLQIGNAWR